jgi:hypothetical protein
VFSLGIKSSPELTVFPPSVGGYIMALIAGTCITLRSLKPFFIMDVDKVLNPLDGAAHTLIHSMADIDRAITARTESVIWQTLSGMAPRMGYEASEHLPV